MKEVTSLKRFMKRIEKVLEPADKIKYSFQRTKLLHLWKLEAIGYNNQIEAWRYSTVLSPSVSEEVILKVAPLYNAKIIKV